MSRKPYHAKQPANWFLKQHFYMWYMLRELTSIPVALYALNLMWGLASLVSSEAAWLNWIHAQQHGVMVLLALIALVGAGYHTMTWFQATPKILKIQLGEKFVPEKIIWLAHWAGFAVIALILLGLVAYLA